MYFMYRKDVVNTIYTRMLQYEEYPSPVEYMEIAKKVTHL